jgi:hypothetical protein
MFQTKVAQKLKTSILCSINFFFFENRVVISENVEKYRRAGQATNDNMAHPHYMLDTYGYRHTHTHTQTHTHTEYALIIAFRLLQWLHERASMLHYTYIDCIVVSYK